MLKNGGGGSPWWLVPAGFVLIGATSWVSASEPMIGLGLIGGIVSGALVFGLPRDRAVGVVGSICLAMVLLFPVHLVPNNIRVAELGAVAALSLFALARRGFSGGSKAIPLMFAAYLALTFAATASGEVEDAMPQFVFHAVIGVGFLIFGSLASESEQRTMTKTLVALGVLQAAYAVVEVIVQPPVLWASPVPEDFIWDGARLPSELVAGMVRGQGSFGHPLLLAFVLLIASALLLRVRLTPARFLCLGVLAAGVLATGSRSASLILAAMVLFTLGAKRFAFIRGLFLAGAASMLVIGTGVLDTVIERFSESGSLTHRQGAIDALPRLLGEQDETHIMFGNGWYAREELYNRGLLQLDGFVAVDNQFISLIVSAGLVGLGLFFMMMLWSVRRSKAGPGLALLVALFMFLVFDVNEFPATWAVLVLLVGYSASCVRKPKKEAAPEVKRERLPDWATPGRNPQLVRRSARQ